MLQEVQGVSAAELLVGGAGVMLYSEFRDGNVPAGHEQLRVLKDSLRHLPDSVKRVSLRRIPQAIRKSFCSIAARQRPALWRDRVRDRADVTEALRAAVRTTPESAWKPLIRKTTASRSTPIKNGRGRLRAQLPDTAATAPITAFSRSARGSRQLALATRRSCRFQRRPLARRFTNSLPRDQPQGPATA